MEVLNIIGVIAIVFLALGAGWWSMMYRRDCRFKRNMKVGDPVVFYSPRYGYEERERGIIQSINDDTIIICPQINKSDLDFVIRKRNDVYPRLYCKYSKNKQCGMVVVLLVVNTLT